MISNPSNNTKPDTRRSQSDVTRAVLTRINNKTLCIKQPEIEQLTRTFVLLTEDFGLKGIFKLEIILIYRYNNLVLQIV